MKVAIFTDNDFAKVNGVTTTLRAVLDHAPEDVHTRVYTCADRAVDTPHYLAVTAPGIGIPFYREMKMYLPPFARFVRQARTDGIDLIHFTTPGPVGLAAMHVAARLRIPMIGSFHTDLAEYARVLSGSASAGRLMQQYMRWPYGKCRRIFVPSEATRRMLVDVGMHASRISIWRRGVSTTRFSPARWSAPVRLRWGLEPGQLALLYVGRVSKEKGLDVLGPLSDRLTQSRVRHKLIVVGDGGYRQELAARCPDAVFTGTLNPDGVAEAMASADLFVFPSRTDTAGNVVLEAQASGLPVLVTDEGGPQENMTHGETGFVCPDLRAFGRRVAELAWNGEQRARFSAAARDYAEGRKWSSALAPLYHGYREALIPATAPSMAVPTTTTAPWA